VNTSSVEVRVLLISQKKKGNYEAKSENPERGLNRNERILQYKQKHRILSRKERRRKKYSSKFNEMFTFFLQSYRTGILDFCGVEVKTKLEVEEQEGKFCFRKFENGEYSKEDLFEGIPTRHPNILKGVIVGKKAWGLWVNEWTDGITDFLFKKSEILEQFEEKGIEIPSSFRLEFDKLLEKKFRKKYNTLDDLERQ
jgi:hypothetical protein